MIPEEFTTTPETDNIGPRKVTFYFNGPEKEYHSLKSFHEDIYYEQQKWAEFNNDGRISEHYNKWGSILSYIESELNNRNNGDFSSTQLDNAVSTITVTLSAKSDIGAAILSIPSTYEKDPDAIIDGYLKYSLSQANTPIHVQNKLHFDGTMRAYFDGSPNLANDYIRTKENRLEAILNDFEKNNTSLTEKSISFKNALDTEQANLYQLISENFEKRRQEMDDLAKTYQEKLKLEKPAQYWQEKAEEHKSSRCKWVGWSLGVGVILMLLLVLILYNFHSCLKDIPELSMLSFTSLRGTIILTLIVSIGVYLLRLFVKFAISSEHLARDAEERKALTYFYLSLISTPNAIINDADRAAIYNALFSRADTGLLKGDSSPTIPEGLASAISKLRS